MSALRKDRTVFALRGKALVDRVKAFSADLEVRRAEMEKHSWNAAEVLADPASMTTVLQELQVRGEELSVAEEELRAQLDELVSLNETLHRQQLQHREVFDFSPEPLVVTDAVSTTIRTANAAAQRLFGHDVDGHLRKPLSSFVDEETANELRSCVLALRPGTSAVLEVVFCPAGVPPVWVELRGFKTPDGERILWSAHDITERRRNATHLREANADLEEHVAARTRELQRALRDKEDLLQRERELRGELEVAGRAKDRFLAILSHDLRSPLNAVLGWTSLLRREILDSASRDRALATIERNARVQAELIEQLLDVSRITAGQLPLEMRSVGLARVVRQAVESMLPTCGAKGVLLVDETPAGVEACVLGDVARLRQVITNLLTNAVKFTPGGGRVTVAVTADGDQVALTVTDTGCGIAPDTIPQIFDVYRQLGDPSINRSGLGLGLFIVKQIVEMHGGGVSAASDGPGKGTQLKIWLPMRAPASVRLVTPVPAPLSVADALAPDSEHVDLSHVKVLLVEDDADTRELLMLALERRGARVFSTLDAESALDAYRARFPDVVLSDVGLPSASGYQLLERIRAHEKVSDLPRTPAIAISGFASNEDTKRAFAAGFDAHIGKPLVPTDVLRVVARLALDAANRVPRT